MIFRLFLLIVLLNVIVSHANAENLKTIKVAVIQPFSEQSSTASSRYKANFENALFYALGKNEYKINQCGARYRVDLFYYPADALIEANKIGHKVEKENYWFAIAPQRAKHCQAVAENTIAMPFFTLNATGDGCVREANLRFSTSLPSSALVKGLVTKIKKLPIKNYAVVEDKTCPECIEFESIFDDYAKKEQIEKKFKVSAINLDTSINLNDLFENLRTNKANALVIPNYSKFAGYIMAKVHEKYPDIIFLGNDGWGQGDWSYIPFFNLPNTVKAYSVRSYLPIYNPGSISSLDKIYQEKMLRPSNLASSTIAFFDKITNFICDRKIKTRSQLVTQLSTQPANFAREGGQVVIYKLSKGKLILDGNSPATPVRV